MSRVPVHPHQPVAALLATLAILALLSLPAGVLAKPYGAWTAATSIESLPGSSGAVNTASVDGCPIQSPDGLSLYMASNRAGGLGGLDIWVAHRSSPDVGFGEPVNLGAPINSAVDDFCPTPVRGKGLFFVSGRAVAGACGLGDIYFARDNPAHGWTDPVNLGCQVNSTAGEAGPSYVETDAGAWLYFSSGPEIMASPHLADGSFGPAAPAAELNSAAADLRPNVRKGGLEIVFDSDRAGGLGGLDLWFATRASPTDPWSAPVNGGPALNSALNETRGSFSWDGATLLFGRAPGPEGLTDIFISTRD
ncbi:MAG TPA: hypothetical protein VLS28_02520 [Candidatus Sulfomarinibacteraceae bacterium]|nr:hypothetical protein [Candidatus Sulfomarinibacteraceae bacterium]